MTLSLGQLAVLAGAVGLLAIGLLLWVLERGNPNLLAFAPSPRRSRWWLPTAVVAVALLGTATFFVPPPLGAENRSFPLLAVLWVLILIVVGGWLKTHPSNAAP